MHIMPLFPSRCYLRVFQASAFPGSDFPPDNSSVVVAASVSPTNPNTNMQAAQEEGEGDCKQTRRQWHVSQIYLQRPSNCSKGKQSGWSLVQLANLILKKHLQLQWNDTFLNEQLRMSTDRILLIPYWFCLTIQFCIDSYVNSSSEFSVCQK